MYFLLYIYVYVYVCVYAPACACWRPSLDQFAVGLVYIYYIGTAAAAAEPRSILPGEREKSWHRFNDLLLLLYTSGRSACQFSQLVGSAASVCVYMCIYIYDTSSTGPSSPRTRGVRLDIYTAQRESQ